MAAGTKSAEEFTVMIFLLALLVGLMSGFMFGVGITKPTPKCPEEKQETITQTVTFLEKQECEKTAIVTYDYRLAYEVATTGKVSIQYLDSGDFEEELQAFSTDHGNKTGLFSFVELRDSTQHTQVGYREKPVQAGTNYINFNLSYVPEVLYIEVIVVNVERETVNKRGLTCQLIGVKEYSC